jgi:hypothetical protein
VATKEEGGDNELNDEGVGEGSGACLGGHEELRRSAVVGDRLQKKKERIGAWARRRRLLVV